MTVDEHEPLPPLSRGTLFRDGPTRLDPEATAAALSDPRARFALISGELMLARIGQDDASKDATELVLLSAEQIHALDDRLLSETLQFFLGRKPDGSPVFACHLSLGFDPDALSTGAKRAWISLRDSVAVLSDQDRGIFTTALALARWHESGTYSPMSGSVTIPEQGGWMRRDEQTGAEIYPRTDPAVIVLITDDDDRVLLGSHILWDANRYSLLAGFVEAGESLEAAVHREIAEEAGIEVSNIRYVASQPWPYPRSLMLGFTARLAPGQDSDAIAPDETELADLRWFSRAELKAAESTVMLPGEASIARFLINRWLFETKGPSA